MIKVNKFFFEWCAFAILIILAVILSATKVYSLSVINGVKLWFTCVLPSLFPYFVITALLSSLSIPTLLAKKLSPLTTKVFNCNGLIGYAYFMSLISGYPIGSKIISDLKNNNLISEIEARRGSALCSTSSPMFLINTVGNLMFNHSLLGLLLLIANLISSIIIGVLFALYKRKDKSSVLNKIYTQKNADNIIYESVFNSISSILFVGGLITVFFVFTDVLINTGILTPLFSLFSGIFSSEQMGMGVTLSLFEYTKGLSVISKCEVNLFTLPVISAITGFGGLSIILQSVSFLKNAKIKTTPFILSKIISMVINFLIGLILSSLFLGKLS